MAAFTFHHGDPQMVDYTPGSAAAAGAGRIVNGVVRITHRDIEAGRLGAEAVPSGKAIYKLAKPSGTEAFAEGADVPFHEANQTAETTGGTADVGLTAVAAAGINDDYVLVQHGS